MSDFMLAVGITFGFGFLIAIGSYGLSLVDAFVTRNPVDQIKFRDKGGTLSLIHNVTGRHENEDWFLVPGEREIGLFEKATKLVIYGFTPISRIRRFQNWNWVAWEQNEEGKWVLKNRHLDSISEFYHQFPYGALVDDVEIERDLRVNLKVQFTFQIASPRRAFGKNRSFLQMTIPKAVGAIGQVCGGKDFAIIKEMLVGGANAKMIQDVVRRLNGIDIDPATGEPVWDGPIDPEGFLIQAGVIIIGIDIVEIESPAAADLEAAARAKLRAQATVEEAEGKRLATEKDADAKAYTKRQEADAEAYAIDKKTKAEITRVEQYVTALGQEGAAAVLASEKLPNLQALGSGTLTTLGLTPKK